jgi:hypothetical protein
MNEFYLKPKLYKRVKKFIYENDIEFRESSSNKFHHRKGSTPSGKICRFNLFCKNSNKNIAHYAFLPMKLIIANNVFLGGQSSNVWVDNNFQGKGLSSYLISKSLSNLKEKGYYFHYGFPNEKMYKIWKNSINVNYIGTGDFLVKPNKLDNILKKKNIHFPKFLIKIINILLKNIPKLFFLFRKKNLYSIEIIEKFTEDFNKFIKRNTSNSVKYFEKNHEELNWRYAFDNYKIFVAKNKKSEICGYLVSSLQKKENLNLGTLIDFHLKKNEEIPLLKNLLFHFENEFKECDFYCYLCLPSQPQKELLKKFMYYKLNTSNMKRSFWMFFQSLRNLDFRFENYDWNITFYDSTDSF